MFLRFQAAQSKAVDGPELFDKDQRAERLILKNQIAYHSKKIVREVTQELFVSRKIDVSPLYRGIEVVKQAKEGLKRYCGSLDRSEAYTPASRLPLEPTYTVVDRPVRASFAEAKARCEALGLQLPEIYEEQQRLKFVHFMEVFNISYCFAGLQPDITGMIHRFIATGFPIWRALQYHAYTKENQTVDITNIMDDVNARFFYSQDGRLVVTWNYPAIIHDPNQHLGSHVYWEKQNEFSQVLTRIVCEPKWRGDTYQSEMGTMQPQIPKFIVKNRFMRDASSPFQKEETMTRNYGLYHNKTKEKFQQVEGLKNFCHSIVSQADEIQRDTSYKLEEVLSLVDIKVRYENQEKIHGRMERAAFLAQYIFTTGIRLIFGLVGFLDKMRMNRKIKYIENTLSIVQGQVNNHTKQIEDMSRLIYGNSIAIQQLTIATANLDRRLTSVEVRVKTLEETVEFLIDKVEATISLSLIANLLGRIQQSLDTGYDVIKDIVHSSLLDQTSPLLLPAEQMAKVQKKVSDTDAVLDTDFAKMQSIIVSDPEDPHLLLVVINIAALSRRNVELVKLSPVPFYEGTETFIPVLDYNTVLLDQPKGTFSILNDEEEYNCLFDRCYNSDVEHSIFEKSCGIPQLTGENPEACMTEKILSHGVYVRPMLPDGVVFAFQREVSTQLYCDEDRVIGPNKSLNGTGIMRLPNGCTLTIRDQGRKTQVKGQPISHLVNGGELKLTQNEPWNTMYEHKNGTSKLKTHPGLMTEHMSFMIQQWETVDAKIANQSTYIWSLVGMILVVTIGLSIIMAFLFRFSGRFRLKIYDLRDSFEHVFRRLSEVETKQDESKRERFPPIAPRPPADVVLTRIPVPPQPNRIFSPNVSRSSTYFNLNEFRPGSGNSEACRSFKFSPVNCVQKERHCPNAPPFSEERLGEKLLSEQREMEELCNDKGPKSEV